MRIHLLQKYLSLSLLIKSMRKLAQKDILMLSLKALWVLVYYFLRSNLLFIRLSSFSIVLSPHFIESYLFTWEFMVNFIVKHFNLFILFTILTRSWLVLFTAHFIQRVLRRVYLIRVLLWDHWRTLIRHYRYAQQSKISVNKVVEFLVRLKHVLTNLESVFYDLDFLDAVTEDLRNFLTHLLVFNISFLHYKSK